MRADRLRPYSYAARHAFSAALILIGVLALYRWVLAPHVTYLHAMQRFGSVVDRVAEEHDRISDARAAKLRHWRSLREERARLEEGVFTAVGARAFARGLLPLVEEVGCLVVAADFAGPGRAGRSREADAPAGIEMMHVNLAALGQPDQVSALLQWLGEHRPRVWIDSCRGDVSDGQAGRVACTLTLTLCVREDSTDGNDRRESTTATVGSHSSPVP